MGPRLADRGGKATDRDLHDSRARDCGADHEGTTDNDHDVIGKAGKGVFGCDNSNSHRSEQRASCNKVVAPLAPDEGNHHQKDDGKGEKLRGGHFGGSIVKPLTLQTQKSATMLTIIRQHFGKLIQRHERRQLGCQPRHGAMRADQTDWIDVLSTRRHWGRPSRIRYLAGGAARYLKIPH